MTKTQSAAVTIAIVGLLSAKGAAQGAASKAPVTTQTVVFVCEHGAAKSVIATTCFNKLAAERAVP